VRVDELADAIDDLVLASEGLAITGQHL
jgi:hypothetical protein